MPKYRAVLITPSCARVAKGLRLAINSFPGRAGPVDLSVHSEYVEVNGASLPGLLTFQAEGEAPSLGVARRAHIESAIDLAAVVAVAANATVDAPQLERAYDITPGEKAHEFYKNSRPYFSQHERRVREVQNAGTQSLVKAITLSADRDRVLRTARQYRLALTYWQPGLETLALAHLYMGVETLAEVALRQELAAPGMSEDALAVEWKLGDPERGTRLHSNLVSHARRRVIFQGDDDTHRKARAASDGFEHGFKDLTEVDALSAEVKARTAAYLREAILRLSGAAADDVTALLTAPYNFILHAGPPTFELHAELVGDVANLAPAGLEHPDVEFENLEAAVRKVEGGIEVLYGGFATWQLGAGVYAKKDIRIESDATPTRADDSSTKPVRTNIVRLPREGSS